MPCKGFILEAKNKKYLTNKQGFTLIELLVVIAIIALLIAILMPAILRAKNEAKSLLCRAKLKDWGFYFYLYVSDNNGFFMRSKGRIKWVPTMRPYYKDPEALLCPKAKKPAYPTASVEKPVGSTFKAWGRWWTRYDEENSYGSYGLNSWLFNEPKGQKWYSHDTDFNWTNIHVKGAIAANVPLFLDCVWIAASPENGDKPLGDEDEIPEIKQRADNMPRFCINRHEGYINGTFLDFSVRKIGLKELWKLKWHREYNTNYQTPDWPAWMRKFRDY